MLENIRAGNLRALAVTSEERLDLLPDVPAIAEEIPGFKAEMWVALYAPAGTPRPIIDRLHTTVRDALHNDETEARFKQLGMTLMKVGPDELATLQAAEYKRWGEVVKASGANAN